MTDLADLIARVEGAQGPDRGLDAEIAEAVGWIVNYDKADPHDTEPYYQPVPEYSWKAVPAYTASVDAALMLVPEWASYSLYDVIGKPESVRMWGDRFDVLTQATTPALALCAAALRAIAAQGEG